MLLITTSIVFVYPREDRNLLDNLKDVYPYLETLDKQIYIDDRSIRALDYISQYDNQLDMEEYSDDLKSISDAYIVINRGMIKNLREANKNRVFPEEIDNPAEEWTVVKEIGKYDESKIVVYYVP